MRPTNETLVLGAVAYDPKVVSIWEGFRGVLNARGLAFDFVLFSNYERQVEALFAGLIDVAWNSPLAWIESERLAGARGRRASAVAMRDSDMDLTSVILVRATDPSDRLEDLRGRTVAVGAWDSPQATMIPLLQLMDAGLTPGRDFEVQRHDTLVGKHGDHIGGERDAVRALLTGRADAACILDASLLAFGAEGTLPPGTTRVLHETPPYDHCNFTTLDGPAGALVDRFIGLLMAMSYDDPQVRHLMDQEGLKAWRPGRIAGYAQLERAVTRLGTIDSWLKRMGG
jgi:ABC-type phosphate/phosphonate transport system substrate-binding protein